MSNPQLVGLINQTHAVKLLNQYRNLAYLICPSWYIPEGPDDVQLLDMHAITPEMSDVVQDLNCPVTDRPEHWRLTWNSDGESSWRNQVNFLIEQSEAWKAGRFKSVSDHPELHKLLSDRLSYDDVHQLRNSGAFNFIAETKGVWSAHHNGYALNISSETKGVVQLQWYIKHSRVLLGTVRIDTL